MAAACPRTCREKNICDVRTVVAGVSGPPTGFMDKRGLFSSVRHSCDAFLSAVVCLLRRIVTLLPAFCRRRLRAHLTFLAACCSTILVRGWLSQSAAPHCHIL